MQLALCLPRDALSVSLVRHILDSALAHLGVDENCRDDVGLAISEACANVIRHAAHSDAYDVDVTVDADVVTIDVVDNGAGLDHDLADTALGNWTAESGRGLHVIRAVTDDMQLCPRQPHGLMLRLTKYLTWRPDAPGRSRYSIPASE